jgi:nicotinate phosphoribosyltransferase
MVAGYVAHRRFEPATFELFVRHLPERRPYLVTAGLSEAVAYLTEFGFSGEDLDYLRGLEALGGADPSFWEYLRGLRFSGEAWAMPEGTAAFADEPIVRVRAPLPEAQIVETALLSSLVYPTLVATKAARIVDAACCDGRERPVIDFGARRAPGFEAACLAARAAAIGGCQATSNVERPGGHLRHGKGRSPGGPQRVGSRGHPPRLRRSRAAGEGGARHPRCRG